MYPIDNQPTIRTIESIKLDVIALSGKDIMLKSRKGEIVLARQSAMMLAKIFTTLNNTDIGRAFSKDHATTVYAIQCVKNAIETNYRPMLDIFEPLYKQYYTEFLNLESRKSEMTGKDLERMAKIKKRVTEAVEEFHILYSIRFKSRRKMQKNIGFQIQSSIDSFNAGVQITQRWIPVEEEKPELYTPVFVKMSYNFFNMDSFAIDCCYWNGESWINAIRQQHSNGSVTHWRPIEYPIL